jgi:hypothetical protein
MLIINLVKNIHICFGLEKYNMGPHSNFELYLKLNDKSKTGTIIFNKIPKPQMLIFLFLASSKFKASVLIVGHKCGNGIETYLTRRASTTKLFTAVIYICS